MVAVGSVIKPVGRVAVESKSTSVAGSKPVIPTVILKSYARLRCPASPAISN